jgi:hypothetical protein
MNLSDLATYICTKVNQSEAEDVAACKTFLTRRMQMIWNVALWKDALVAFEQTLSPTGYTPTSTWLPTKGVLLCPPIIERVVAARLQSNRLSVQRQEYYFCIDYDSFAKQGKATEFVLLPKCVWQTDSAIPMVLTAAEAPADSSAANTIEVLSSDGISVTRLVVYSTADLVNIATTDTVMSWTKPTTTDVFNILEGPDGDGNIAQLSATDLSAPRRERIRLLQIPTEEQTIRVLGKRTMPTFSNDLDEPALNGVENCLLAFAQADMLQRERQYGKAQAMQTEALGLLDQLKDLEVVQQAHHVTITPGDGFVSEYQFNSGTYAPLTF